MDIKCSLCGEKYSVYFQDGDSIDVDPHTCPIVEENAVAFITRVCSTCDDQIRCIRDGFECREAF